MRERERNKIVEDRRQKMEEFLRKNRDIFEKMAKKLK